MQLKLVIEIVIKHQSHQTAHNQVIQFVTCEILHVLQTYLRRTTKISFHIYHPTLLKSHSAFASFHRLATQISDSDGYVLYSRKNATRGKFSFTTETAVMFDVCFLSRSPMGE